MDQRPVLSAPAAKPWKPVAGLVVILFVATLIGGWLYVESVRNDLEMRIEASEKPAGKAPAPTTGSAPVPAGIADLTFDPATVAVGDRIGAWTVTEVEGDEPGSPRRVRLAGTAAVSGTYAYHSDDEPFFSGLVTFRTDEAAAAAIPRAENWNYADPGGKPYRFFAFADAAAVRQAFGPAGSTGQASVGLREYTVNLIEGEAFDTAEFVRRTDR